MRDDAGQHSHGDSRLRPDCRGRRRGRRRGCGSAGPRVLPPARPGAVRGGQARRLQAPSVPAAGAAVRAVRAGHPVRRVPQLGQLQHGHPGFRPAPGAGPEALPYERPGSGWTDDQSHPSATDPPSGTGESSGALQGLLQPLHHLPQGQNAIGKLAPVRLRLRLRAQQQQQLPFEREQFTPRPAPQLPDVPACRPHDPRLAAPRPGGVLYRRRWRCWAGRLPWRLFPSAPAAAAAALPWPCRCRTRCARCRCLCSRCGGSRGRGSRVWRPARGRRPGGLPHRGEQLQRAPHAVGSPSGGGPGPRVFGRGPGPPSTPDVAVPGTHPRQHPSVPDRSQPLPATDGEQLAARQPIAVADIPRLRRR